MHKDVIEACPLTSEVSLACAKRLLTRSTVQVCLKNEYVVRHNELARELFILVKGSLQISLPATSMRMGGKAGMDVDSPTARQSIKKNSMQFRMLEKQGGITGMWSPYESGLRYPFEVRATEFTVMLNVGKACLLESMHIFDEDRPKILRSLDREFELVERALRIGRGIDSSGRSRSVDSDADSARTKKEEGAYAKRAASSKVRTTSVLVTLEGVSAGLDKVGKSVSQVKKSAELLPTLLEKLGHTISDDAAERLRGSGISFSATEKTPRPSTRADLSGRLLRQVRFDSSRRTTDPHETADEGAEADKRQITADMEGNDMGVSPAALAVL
jgi:hypothetical protein